MRLINADELYRKVKTECNPYGKPSICFECGKKVLNYIDNAPTVEFSKEICSACGRYIREKGGAE